MNDGTREAELGADPAALQAGQRTGIGEGGQMLLDISNRVVRIHKEFYGKGPTKARANVTRDLLTVLLEGGFTRSEQTLRDSGHAREVAESRYAMQQSVTEELTRSIEQITGRRVRSFMSANDPDAEIQVEIFVLSSEDASTRAERPVEDAASHAEDVHEQHHELLDEHRALRSEQVQSREALRRRREGLD